MSRKVPCLIVMFLAGFLAGANFTMIVGIHENYSPSVARIIICVIVFTGLGLLMEMKHAD